MNEKVLKRSKKDALFFTTFLGLLAASASAQNGVAIFGNTHIGPDTELHVKSYPLYLTGIATTQRGATPGKLSLSNATTLGPSSATGYVNGFVRRYSASTVLFPVGSTTVYAPVTISPLTQQAIDVAYNSEGFNTASFNTTVLDAVSAAEHWDVLSSNSGAVTLIWQAASNLSLLADDINNLTIAGWDGTSWIPLQGIIAGGSTFAEGSVSSILPVDFTTYSAFTFAAIHRDVAAVTKPDASHTFMAINNDSFGLKSAEGVSAVEIYDMAGKMVQSYTVKSTAYEAEFAHAKGIYIAKALLDNGKTVTRKLLNQ